MRRVELVMLLAVFLLPLALTPQQAHGYDESPTVERLVLAYYFPWYDWSSVNLANVKDHPVNPHQVRWSSAEWHERELVDMIDAEIDVALVTYWGASFPWSLNGLQYLIEAEDKLTAEGRHPPKLALDFDTNMYNYDPRVGEKERDLLSTEGKLFFYGNVRDFYSTLPRRHWALFQGRPFVWIWLSGFFSQYDQSLFEYVYDKFLQDFGVRPYIVRESSWNHP